MYLFNTDIYNDSHIGDTDVNASLHDVTDATASDIGFFIYYYGILLTLSVIGIVGNSMVVVGIVRHSALRTPANYFILSLAISDLLLAICYPIYDVTHLDDDYIQEALGN